MPIPEEKRTLRSAFHDAPGDLVHIKRITIAVSVTVLATASGRADDNRACISKATAALPHIAGLVVRKTRTRPAPPAILATWQGQTRPIMVDLDVFAADAAETYSYMCVTTKGSAYVRRVMG